MTTKAQLGEVLDVYLETDEDRPKRNKRTHFIGAHITERLKKALEDEAALEDVSMSSLVFRILSEAIQIRRAKRIDNLES